MVGWGRLAHTIANELGHACIGFVIVTGGAATGPAEILTKLTEVQYEYSYFSPNFCFPKQPSSSSQHVNVTSPSVTDEGPVGQ